MNEKNNRTPECCCKELKDYAQENPLHVVLAALGLGLLIALIVRPRKVVRAELRALHLLEDIQHRVKEIAEPAYHRAVTAAEKSAAAFKEKAAEQLDDLDIPASLCTLKRKIRHLFK
jgi:hypothetical protein